MDFCVEDLTPIFSLKQKNGKQILLVKKRDGLKATLISSLEADFFKKHLEKTQPKDMWLVLPDSALLR